MTFTYDFTRASFEVNTLAEYKIFNSKNMDETSLAK